MGKAHLASELSEQWSGEREASRSATQKHFTGELLVWALTLEPAKLFSAMLPTEPPQRAHCEKNVLRITLDELTALALHKWNLAGPKANRPVVFANQRRSAIATIAPDVTQAVSISWQSDDAHGSLAGRNASRPRPRRRCQQKWRS